MSVAGISGLGGQQLTRPPKHKQPAAAPAAAPRPAPPAPALAAAARQQYTGAYSGALNNLSNAEQRVRDVAARRQSDADKYAAYVMGQQGAIAAAAQAQDQRALANMVGVQGATLGAQQSLQAGLQAQRAAQGGQGAVPIQQQAGLVDDQTRTQALLGAASQRQAASANTNAGKAGFLAAAAQASLLANKRGIAGDEFNQLDQIGREKTGVLVQRTQSNQADKRAAAQTAADIEAANAQAASDSADRASREGIAAAAQGSRESIAGAQIAARAQQGRANRRVRLKTAAVTAAAGGYVTPAEQRRRNNTAAKLKSQFEAASGLAADTVAVTASPSWNKGALQPNALRSALRDEYPNLPKEAVELIVANTFNREPGKGPKGQAKRRYSELLDKIAAGEM